MSTIKVSVKWNKQVFEDIELDQSQPPSVFKMQLFSLTAVEPDRQKIMVKGGTLKDDTNWESLKLKDGHTFMMMGTPGEVNVDIKPQIKFIEDMTEAEIAKTTDIPAGLENLGNTCYANATIQCLRAVPELRDALDKYQGQVSGAQANHNITVAMRDLFRQMSSSNSVTPLAFILLMRRAFPQFDQQEHGHYSQQDAEECWSQLVTALGQNLKDGNDLLINKFFGIEYTSSWTCDDDPSEPPRYTVEQQSKLQCHITQEVNYLYQGIREGLTEKIEKHSEKLNRTAIYSKTSKISKLPSYLTVNFVRFFWRKDTRKKAKILRKVSYPMELDMFDFCTEDLQKKLQPARALLAEKEEIRKNEKGKEKSSEMQVDVKYEPVTGENRSGFYELIAVLTHIGRSSDSGHYIAWAKKKNDEWLKFDDDKVSVVKDEDILKLDGGGDWHMAYLCLYREKPLPTA